MGAKYFPPLGRHSALHRMVYRAQHLPASRLPTFMNLQLKWQSEGGQEFWMYKRAGY